MKIKSRLGKLHLGLPLDELIRSQAHVNGLTTVAITLPHILALRGLPVHHSDPFDRLLLAQTLVENATLVTGDTQLHRYSEHVRVLW